MQTTERCQMFHKGPENVIVSPAKLICPVRGVCVWGGILWGTALFYEVTKSAVNRAKEREREGGMK